MFQYDNIYNACEAAIKEDLLTVVNIETSAYHQFLPSHFENHPRYQELKKEDQKDLFSYVTSPWISVGSPEEAGSSNDGCPFGCDDIYDSIAVDPHGNVHACCGLVINTIPEMTIGNIFNDSLSDILNKNDEDLLKSWIYVDSPLDILSTLSQYSSDIYIPKYAHRCQWCQFLFHNEEVQRVISDHFDELKSYVDIKKANKLEFKEFINQI